MQANCVNKLLLFLYVISGQLSLTASDYDITSVWAALPHTGVTTYHPPLIVAICFLPEYTPMGVKVWPLTHFEFEMLDFFQVCTQYPPLIMSNPFGR